MNLEKLRHDAKVARVLAEAAAHVTVDNGSANLDSTFLRIDRGIRAAAVIEALRGAGLQACESRWLGRGVMVQPPGCGQANKRHASNETIFSSLSGSGWPVTPYYQLD